MEAYRGRRPVVGEILPGGRFRALDSVPLIGPNDARQDALDAVRRQEPLRSNRKARRAAKAKARRSA